MEQACDRLGLMSQSRIYMKVHYRVYKRPSLVSILMQMKPVHSFPHYLSKISSVITFPSMSRSSKWSRPFSYSDKEYVWFSHLSHACYITCLSHPPSFDHTNNIWCWIQVNVLHYAIFSTFAPIPPSQVQIYTSAPCFQTLSISVLLLMLQINCI